MEGQDEQAAKPIPNCAAQCRGRRQEFRWVVYVGKQIYCYWEEKRAETRVDYERLARELEAKITDDTTLTGYYQILQEWAASFHDGHVNVLVKKDSAALDVYTAPVRLEVLAPGTDHEKVIVSSSQVVALSVGEEVTHVNGVPVLDRLGTLEKITSGSTARMRRYKAARLLVDAHGAREGAQDLKLRLKNNTEELALPRTAELRPTESPASPNVRSVMFPGAIGVLWIGGFGGADAEQILDRAMDSVSEARALVIDLRQNHGGDLSGDRIIARLADREVIRYRRSERLSDILFAARPTLFPPDWDGTTAFAPWHSLRVRPAGRRFTGPVWALIGPECFSACDTFTASLKANQLATLVGEPTGGGTGTPHVIDLPRSGLRFRYSVIRGKSPSGHAIEGVGTEPNVLVEPAVTDRVRRRDAVMARTLDLIRERIGGVGTGATMPLAEPAVSTASIPMAREIDLSPTRDEAAKLDAIADFDEREPR